MKNIYKYLFIFFILIIVYVIIIFIKKYILIGQILTEWKKKTKGKFIKMDNTDYFYDYYLCFNNSENINSHIHLLTFKSYNFYNILKLCYAIKQNNIHSIEFNINFNQTPTEICNEMIHNFINFDKIDSYYKLGTQV